MEDAGLAIAFAVTVLTEAVPVDVTDVVVLTVTVCEVSYGVVCVLYQNNFLLIAKLTNSFRIYLNVRSVIGVIPLKCGSCAQ